MNELELLATLRDEVPLSEAHPAVADLVLTAISSRPRRVRRPRRALLATAAGTLALAAAASYVLGLGRYGTAPQERVITWSGRPGAIPLDPGISVGRARTAAELADFATRAATADPGTAPGPHEWVYMKIEVATSSHGGGGFLFGPPDERVVGLDWNRVDWREDASTGIPANLPPTKLIRGHLSIVPEGPGTLAGWKSISYSYLNSLPTDPARLESVILANYDSSPRPADNVAIFDSIFTLFQGETEGAWVPPRLAATMYRVLEQLPGVHFDNGTDLAGRTGIGLYMVEYGWFQQELVINPVTYKFMGSKDVAAEDHTMVGTDGTRHVTKGQVLGWQALLFSAIVRHAGQIP